MFFPLKFVKTLSEKQCTNLATRWQQNTIKDMKGPSNPPASLTRKYIDGRRKQRCYTVGDFTGVLTVKVSQNVRGYNVFSLLN